MKDVILFLAKIVDTFHDLFLYLSETFGLGLTDKELHFWIVGFFGFLSFLLVHIAFRVLSKWSITAISFIYTFTMVLVFVFALEIQQGITGSGNMEFDDAAIGVVGFFVFFGVYLLIRGITFGIKRLHYRKKHSVDT
ncbi:hypothetical protein [Pontibacillus marinus]|uniref:Membrane protein n=1 Tax=Pontibacillus marinus BH030004 = DSM 16465 TaxID=1385511 RepID=A0A0A5G1K9_9BACI|nr:hypothetical protein [Pontibacillus marinus]KGX85934.1 membrane protein [Pontibacillus marinus BH030004 = DSM 16465]